MVSSFFILAKFIYLNLNESISNYNPQVEIIGKSFIEKYLDI